MPSFRIFLVRHEERYVDGLWDCPLTPSGVQRSCKGLLDRLVQLGACRTDGVNVYCSPTLRTVQTIVPFMQKCIEYPDVKRPTIMFEDSLYELLNNKIKHYCGMKDKPKYTSTKIFYHEVDMINDLVNWMEKNFMRSCRDRMRILINRVHEYSTYDILESNLMDMLESIMFGVDSYIISGDTTPYIETDMGINTVQTLKYIASDMEDVNVDKCIDETYVSVIDIDEYYNDMKDGECEDKLMLQMRTNGLVEKIITDEAYQNAVYVSHSATIREILKNLVLCFDDNEENKELYDSVSQTEIPMGSVVEVVINKEPNNNWIDVITYNQ